MTAFEEAWDLVKMPLWYESGTTADYLPKDYSEDDGSMPDDWLDNQPFSLLANPHSGGDEQMDIHSLSGLPRFWESKDKDARGFVTFREGDAPDDPINPYHQLILFEMARDARRKGLMRDRLQEMIAELREHDPEARSTHVTHSENDTAALWDKMVDEGLLDSASTKPWVTTTPEGRLIRHTKYREDDL